MLSVGCAAYSEKKVKARPMTAVQPAPEHSLRVTHVIYSGLGGHSAVMFSLLDASFMAGATHHVVLAGIEAPPADYITRLEALGVSWRYVGKQAGRGHLDFYRRLRKAIFDDGSDVVFLHGVAAIPAVAMMLGRRTDGPVVILRETEPTQVKTGRVWAMLALAHQCADSVVHLTLEAAEDAQKKLRFLHRTDRTSIIANGLDTDFFSPCETSPPQNEVLNIGMQSRLQPTKDHLSLVDAFALLRIELPDRAMMLHIAGDGPTREAIEGRIAEHGLVESVTMHGMLGRDQVRDFLRDLDIYVHSSFGETQSNAIMQAMATGLPVVASDVPGVSNMIRSGLGVLHRSGDAQDLARKLRHLIMNPDLAVNLGRAAHAEALKVYGARASALAYEKLIAQLLSKNFQKSQLAR